MHLPAAVSGAFFSLRVTSMPSMSGRARSRRMKSGSSDVAWATACSPFCACTTSKPLKEKYSAHISRASS